LTRLKNKEMKKLILTSILMLLAAAGITIMGQERNDDKLGLPGDNLNLYAVMKLFQESKTLEEFEKNLNNENSRINNLDLNGDNQVDYIRVIDNVDGDVHHIVLQDAINAKETQDVAVFTVQRFSNGSVQIQLVGDEDLYGKNYIVEPIFDDSLNGQTPNPGYRGDATTVNGQVVYVTPTTTYEIASWPLIRYIFLPGYLGWHSSWYWDYYPSYWHPWRPFFWDYYYGFQFNYYNYYYGHYRIWHNYRDPYWNDYYYNRRRTYSTLVRERIRDGNYRETYSHPEQRRDGEALYNRTQGSQVSRRTDNPTNTNVRRTDQGQNQVRNQSVNTNTVTRRTESNTVNRTVTNPSQGNRDNAVQRSETNVVRRPVTNQSQVNRSSVSSRTESRVTSTPSSRSQSVQKSVSSRSSAPRSKATVSSGRSGSAHARSVGSATKGSGSKSSSGRRK
jgi:hypothetical protein